MESVVVRVARTIQELEQVRRLRYEVYVEEMGRPQPHADHVGRRVADVLDDTGFVLAAEVDGEVVGTLRLNFVHDGIGAYAGLYGLTALSPDEASHTVIVTAFMVRRPFRGAGVAEALCQGVYALARAEGARVAWFDCNPPLVRWFRGLGFVEVRPLRHPLYGDVHLMRLDLLDADHLRAVRSPLAALVHDFRAHLPRSSPMNTMDRLRTDFEAVAARFHTNPACARFRRGGASVAEYASLMVSVAHQARENPQIQAFATAFFRGHQRELVRTFYKHAVSEIGHDQLAANDAALLGIDTSDLFRRQPRPGAVALTAYAYYAITHVNPVSYLGYLFFLEFLPTRFGAEYMAALDRMGVPAEARTFLLDHATVDVGHNKLMERYVEALVTDDDAYEAVRHAMEVTGALYARMVEEAFTLADEVGQEVPLAPWERSFRPAEVEVHAGA